MIIHKNIIYLGYGDVAMFPSKTAEDGTPCFVIEDLGFKTAIGTSIDADNDSDHRFVNQTLIVFEKEESFDVLIDQLMKVKDIFHEKEK